MNQPYRLRRAFWHTGVYGAGLMLNRGAAMLLVPLYTRRLAEGRFGVYDLCTTTVLFLVPLFELGLGTAVLRFFHQVDGPGAQRRVFSTSAFILLATSAVGTVLLALFAGPLAGAVFGAAADAPLIRLLALVTVLTVANNLVLALLRAEEKSAIFAVLSLARAVAGPAAIVYLLVGRGMGVEGILIGDIAGLAVAGLAGAIVCARWFRFEVDFALMRDMLRFGVPLLPAAIGVAVITVSDRYFLRPQIGLDDMEIFSLGAKLGAIIAFLTRAFQTAWPAAAFQLARQDNGPEVLAKALRLVVFGVCLAALALTAFAPELVRIFGTERYVSAYQYVPWIAFSYCVHMSVMFISTNLAIAHKTMQASLAICAGAAAKLLLNVALIPLYGAWGAAVATFAAFVVELAVMWPLAQRHYRVPFEMGRFAALAGLSAAGAALAVWLAARAGAAPAVLRFAVPALFAAGCLAAGVISADERRAALRMVLPGLTRARSG